jgi:hypothetical protein
MRNVCEKSCENCLLIVSKKRFYNCHRRAAGRAFYASMLLNKKVERTLFVALIGFCKYGISDLDHEDGIYTEQTSLHS